MDEKLNNTDTWYRCTVCGREGTVGRCCGDETRIPLNEKARKEQAAQRHENDTSYRDRVDRMVAAAYSGYFANHDSVAFCYNEVIKSSIEYIDAIDKAIAEREARDV